VEPGLVAGRARDRLRHQARLRLPLRPADHERAAGGEPPGRPRPDDLGRRRRPAGLVAPRAPTGLLGPREGRLPSGPVDGSRPGRPVRAGDRGRGGGLEPDVVARRPAPVLLERPRRQHEPLADRHRRTERPRPGGAGAGHDTGRLRPPRVLLAGWPKARLRVDVHRARSSSASPSTPTRSV
jgi:hypothetical protein